MSEVSPKALVVLRVLRGAAAPDSAAIRAAIEADRARLSLPPSTLAGWRLAGPYAVEIQGQPLDEYVAWEV